MHYIIVGVYLLIWRLQGHFQFLTLLFVWLFQTIDKRDHKMFYCWRCFQEYAFSQSTSSKNQTKFKQSGIVSWVKLRKDKREEVHYEIPLLTLIKYLLMHSIVSFYWLEIVGAKKDCFHSFVEDTRMRGFSQIYSLPEQIRRLDGVWQLRAP